MQNLILLKLLTSRYCPYIPLHKIHISLVNKTAQVHSTLKMAVLRQDLYAAYVYIPPEANS